MALKIHGLRKSDPELYAEFLHEVFGVPKENAGVIDLHFKHLADWYGDLLESGREIPAKYKPLLTEYPKFKLSTRKKKDLLTHGKEN